MKIRSLTILLILTFVALQGGWCQDLDSDTAQAVDTLLFDGKSLMEHASPVTSDINFENRMYQNPTAGLFRSMVVPGWGQLRNKRYTKALIFAGLDAWFITAAIHYGRQTSNFRDLFESTVDIETRNEYYDLYLNRKDSRNKYTWFAVIVTFISMFDAYVDAHLSGYPLKIDDSELSLDIKPTESGGLLASVSLGF